MVVGWVCRYVRVPRLLVGSVQHSQLGPEKVFEVLLAVRHGCSEDGYEGSEPGREIDAVGERREVGQQGNRRVVGGKPFVNPHDGVVSPERGPGPQAGEVIAAHHRGQRLEQGAGLSGSRVTDIRRELGHDDTSRE